MDTTTEPQGPDWLTLKPAHFDTSLLPRKHRKPAEKFNACADHAKGACKRYSLAGEAGAKRSDIEKLAQTALYKDKCHNDATD